MSRSDPTPAVAEPAGGEVPPARSPLQSPRYGRYAGLLGLLILALITLNTINTKPNGDTGIAPGQPLAPFAVPLVQGDLSGDANVATKADEGAAGNVPACSVRKPQVLNVCELYEKGPGGARAVRQRGLLSGGSQ